MQGPLMCGVPANTCGSEAVRYVQSALMCVQARSDHSYRKSCVAQSEMEHVSDRSVTRGMQ